MLAPLLWRQCQPVPAFRGARARVQLAAAAGVGRAGPRHYHRRNRREYTAEAAAVAADDDAEQLARPTEFESAAFLRSHLAQTVRFHLSVDMDHTHGGYYQQLSPEGETTAAESTPVIRLSPVRSH
jgi:hypothetical protein